MIMGLSNRWKISLAFCVTVATLAIFYYEKNILSLSSKKTVYYREPVTMTMNLTVQPLNQEIRPSPKIRSLLNQKRSSNIRILLDQKRSSNIRILLDQTRSQLSLNPEQIVKATLQNTTWREALVGAVWPQDDYNETYTRMDEQIEFLDLYRAIKNASGGVKKPKVILGLGKFNLESFKEGPELFTSDGCPVDWCTASRNVRNSAAADAVVISEYGWNYNLPSSKPSNQIWIAQHWESPKHNRIDTKDVAKLINWTASYRRESHIVTNYGTYGKVQGGQAISKNFAANKTHQVVMLVSNCYPSNSRMAVARELSRYIPVDIFGSCGRFKCPKEASSNSVSCVAWLSKYYKFYLAFENSNCKDYVTEKFTANALQNDILPVVFGANKEDYEAMGPPNSFIHVNDFSTLKALADYLHKLDKNDTLYNEYFKWKGLYSRFNQRYWCRMCTLLHLQSDVQYIHYYKDYHVWWNNVCTSDAHFLYSSVHTLLLDILLVLCYCYNFPFYAT